MKQQRNKFSKGSPRGRKNNGHSKKFDKRDSQRIADNTNGSRRGKKFEVSLPDSQINSADLAPIMKSEENAKAWYNKYPELVAASASLSFSLPLGSSIKGYMGYAPEATNIITPMQTSIPGIMTIGFVPTIGIATGRVVDPINAAANRIYVKIRSVLSTVSDYDANDLMLYLVAMDSIYMLHSMASRAYGVLQNVKVFNRYYSRALVQAMGFDYDDLVKNMANFREQLNYIAYNLNQFWVPADLDYMTRHSWMAGNLFYDAQSVKAQTYMYVPEGYYIYNELPNSAAIRALRSKPKVVYSDQEKELLTLSPARLDFKKLDPEAKLTVNDFTILYQQMVSALMNSQDLIQISGDVLHAFGSNAFVVQPLAENYIIDAIYSPEVLSQIENAMLLGMPYTESSDYDFNIKENVELIQGPNLYQDMAFTGSTGQKYDGAALGKFFDSVYKFKSAFLNFHMDNITPDDVMVATRLMYNVSCENNDDTNHTLMLTPADCGSEVATVCRIYYYTDSDTPGAGYAQVAKASSFQLFSLNNDYDQLMEIMRYNGLWSNFDWAPALLLMWIKSDISTATICRQQDVDNYTIVSQTNIENLHQAALTSLFATPQSTK